MEMDLPRCLRRPGLPGHRILVLCCVSQAVKAAGAIGCTRGTYLIGHNAFEMEMGNMQPTELEQFVTPARLTWDHDLTAEFPLGVMNG